jgi:phosphate transport system substrate-binding protein
MSSFTSSATKRNFIRLGIGVAFASMVVAPISAQAQTATLDTGVTVSGAGSSFMSNFLEQCKADTKKALNINITYQTSGSGAGRSGFIAGTTDFAGSDVAFTSAELSSLKTKFVYIPITIGGVAIVYKVPGVDDLKLSGSTLAKIFSGQITKWNATEIDKENPGANLPSETIRVIVRSDSSGTSNVFTDYLDQASGGAWKKGVTSTFPVPPGTGVAQRGSDGVTNYVAGSQGNYSITYAETSFAEERKLQVAKVINASFEAVKPDAKAITSAISDAKVNEDGTLFLAFNSTKPDAYPISTTAYLIVPQTMDAKKGDVLRTFLTYSLGGCQSKAQGLGYAPLPKNIVDLGLAAVAKVNPGSAPVPTIAGEAAPAVTVASVTTAAATPTTVASKPATTVKPKTTVKGKKKVPTTKKKK